MISELDVQPSLEPARVGHDAVRGVVVGIRRRQREDLTVPAPEIVEVERSYYVLNVLLCYYNPSQEKHLEIHLKLSGNASFVKESPIKTSRLHLEWLILCFVQW